MKYCSHCGSAVNDDARFCMHCGASLERDAARPGGGNATDGYGSANGTEYNSSDASGSYNANYGPASQNSADYRYVGTTQPAPRQSTLSTVAKAFMILGCVTNAVVGAVFIVGLITLAWTLPMTIVYFKKVDRGEPIGTGFKVCSLIFVSLIAGILMLCDKDN